MKEEIIKKLVQIQLQWKFLHWQTYGDAKHRLYGEIYDKLGEFIDEFTEVMMGKYGRPEFEAEFGLMFQDISALNMQNFMDGITEFFVGLSEQLDPKYDSDLLNIRDEMLATINKSKYLITLKY
jgi:hypothetical protein